MPPKYIKLAERPSTCDESGEEFIDADCAVPGCGGMMQANGACATCGHELEDAAPGTYPDCPECGWNVFSLDGSWCFGCGTRTESEAAQ